MKKDIAGQAIIEFMFTMIIVLLMIYSLMMIFRWSGLDLFDRRRSHEQTLTMGINEDYGSCQLWNQTNPPHFCLQYVDPNSGPRQQLDPYYHKPIPMNAIWLGN